MVTAFKYTQIRDLIEAAGFDISFEDNNSVLIRLSDSRLNHPDDEVIIQAIIDSYNHLPEFKAEKIAELKTEAVNRMALVYSFIDDPDYYLFLRDLYMSMVPAARDPLSGNLLQIK